MSSNSLEREDLYLKENHNVGLVFPGSGVVFFTVEARERYKYTYDRILNQAGVTSITADQWIPVLQFKDVNGDDILEVDEKTHLYHLFFGWSPGPLKAYKWFPINMVRGSPDVSAIVAKADYGYWDGYMSPFNDPSPETETFIPVGENLCGFSFHNPCAWTMDEPLVNVEGKIYLIKTNKDVEMVYGMLQTPPKHPVRLATVGGIDQFPYNHRDQWKVDPVKFGATRSEVAEALKAK